MSVPVAPLFLLAAAVILPMSLIVGGFNGLSLIGTGLVVAALVTAIDEA